MQISRLDPENADLTGRTHALVERARAADTPELPARRERLFTRFLRNPPPGSEVRGYVAEDGDVLGYVHLYLPVTDNRHYAEAELTVHPDHRREGVGTALLDHLVDVARAEARTELIVTARATWEDGPNRSEAGPKFLEARGFTAALTEVDRRLVLDDIDPEAEQDLRARAESASAPEYDLVSWTGRTPEEHLERLCRLDSMIFEEIPLGDVELKRREVDVELQRARDDRSDAIGALQIRTVAVHRATGAMVANTAIYAYPDHPDAQQAITIVDPAHRGHRLGLAVKLANLRQLRERADFVTAVWAGNADTNTHMVAINEALGFRTVDALVSYKHEAE